MLTASLLPEYRLRKREADVLLEDALMSVHPGLQTYKIHAARRSTIVTRSGTRVTIPPFAMRTVLGQIVNDEFELYVLENLSPAEMIASNRPSTAEGQLLNSKWQVDVNATYNDIAVQLCKPVLVEVPLHQPMSRLHVFRGCKASIRPYGSDQQSDWQMCPSIPVFQVAENSTLYSRFSLTAFNWYALGSIQEAKKMQGGMLSVRLKEGIGAYDEVRAFLVHPDANSTAYLYEGQNDFKGIGVPDKEKTIAISIARRGSQYFLGSTFRRLDSQKVISIRMSAIPPEHLLDRLSTLCKG